MSDLITDALTGEGVAPRVTNAVALTFSSIRLTFSEPMTRDSALELAANYTLYADGGLEPYVISVVPDAGSSPTFVDLYLSGPMSPGTNNYAIVVANVVDLAGNVIDGDYNYWIFGPGSADFRVVLASAVESNLLRVWFSFEPRHLSPMGTLDALNRLNWTLGVTAGSASVPVVEQVEDARARALPSFSLAWSVDLRVDRALEQRSTYQAVAASVVPSASGTALAVSPYDRASCAGIAVAGTRRPRRAQQTLQGVDFKYLTFEGRFALNSRGDLDLHGGIEALKKRVIRRMMTVPGAFTHLPGYGVGLRSKRLFNATEHAKLRAEILRQIRQEEEVEDLTVKIDVAPTRTYLLVSLVVRMRTGGAFTLGFEVPDEGPVLLAS